jgi:hypothetical protein
VAHASVGIEREAAGLGVMSTEFHTTMLKRVVEAARNFAAVFFIETEHEIRVSDEQRAAAEQWNDVGHEIAAQRATTEESNGSD